MPSVHHAIVEVPPYDGISVVLDVSSVPAYLDTAAVRTDLKDAVDFWAARGCKMRYAERGLVGAFVAIDGDILGQGPPEGPTLNTNKRWKVVGEVCKVPNSGYVVGHVFRHELGHYLFGGGHVDDPRDVMKPSASPCEDLYETVKTCN